MTNLTFLVFLVALYGIIVAPYGLLIGVGRQFSIASAAMWGVGAYTAAIITVHAGLPLWTTVPAALVTGAAAGALVALPALRVGSIYLAIVSFAFQLIFVNLLKNLTPLTGGSSGIGGIATLSGVGPLSRTGVLTVVTVLTAVVVTLLTSLWNRGSFGRVLRVLGGDEDVLQSLGRDPRRIKMQLFALTGAVSAIAGVLYAQFIRFISPETFAIHASITFLMMVLIGGQQSTIGPLLGAVVFVGLPEVITRLGIPDHISAPLHRILFGVILIAFLVFKPLGIAGPRFTYAPGPAPQPDNKPGNVPPVAGGGPGASIGGEIA